jgi:hypothetical protein
MGGQGDASEARPTGLRPSDSELDGTNRRLREFARVGGLKSYAREGEIIFKDLFQQDLDAWESRSPAKMNSIRRLAERPNAPYGKDALGKRISIFIALQSLDFVWWADKITVSHIVEVLRLPQEERVRLLKNVQTEGWSVRKLHKVVVGHRRGGGERRGRPVSPDVRKAIIRLRTIVFHVEVAQGLLPGHVPVDADTREELQKLRDRLEKVYLAISEALGRLAIESPEAELGMGDKRAVTFVRDSVRDRLVSATA